MSNHNGKFLVLLTIGMISLVPAAVAEVQKNQINPDNLVVLVKDDPWQPQTGTFDPGQQVSAIWVAEPGITIDGSEREPAWSKAPESVIKLAHGPVRTASVKAIYTDEEIYLRVRWPDATEDRLYRPWVWDRAQRQFVEGPQVDDSLILSFEIGCEWTPSFLSGYVFDFDGWQWMAARSDPVGQAADMYGSVQDQDFKILNFTRYKSRNSEKVWNVKFTDRAEEGSMTLAWNELDRAYLLQPATDTVYYRADPDGERPYRKFVQELPPPEATPDSVGKLHPRFEPVALTGDAGEIEARGEWRDGYWTVEYRRALVTPARHLSDAVFNRLTQFSVHVFDHTERIDEASESSRLLLRFLEKGVTAEVRGFAAN